MSIENGKVIPQHILMDGNGNTDKGFKCEWATVKDGLMYVGSTGKEWTKNGVSINFSQVSNFFSR
jgi:soluble calcium-activated nucleotidase 1